MTPAWIVEPFDIVEHISNEKSNFGFIDTAGRIVIPYQFAMAGGFKDGTAIVVIGDALNGKRGLVDRTGKFLINPQYAWLWRLGKERFQFRVSDLESPAGILDGHGRIVADAQFASLGNPSGPRETAYYKQLADHEHISESIRLRDVQSVIARYRHQMSLLKQDIEIKHLLRAIELSTIRASISGRVRMRVFRQCSYQRMICYFQSRADRA